MPNLEQAAECFDHWMKEYEDSIREHGLWDNPNRALLNYLDADRGFRYVKSYEDFCHLADLVIVKGYAVTAPPCTPLEFGQAIERANPSSFEGQRPTIPEAARVDLEREKLESLRRLGQTIERCYSQVADDSKDLGGRLATAMVLAGLYRRRDEITDGGGAAAGAAATP